MLLCGYSGLYVPEPKAFHVRGGTIGAQSDLPRFYLVRNALITLLKDLPASILLRSLPKIALYHYGQLIAARGRPGSPGRRCGPTRLHAGDPGDAPEAPHGPAREAR